MAEAALEATRTVQRRLRALPSCVVVHLLLAGCLFPEVGYSGVSGLEADAEPFLRSGPQPPRWCKTVTQAYPELVWACGGPARRPDAGDTVHGEGATDGSAVDRDHRPSLHLPSTAPHVHRAS